MTELDVVLKTAGLANGMRTVAEVKELFGINVRHWPRLFQVHKTDLVSRLPRHEQIFQNRNRSVRAMWNALGII